ncbi:MAG: c-type cytochrome [Candidatus Kapabacteria bacterium]|nr:c-type cytochrome [Candidatus Kapabacteria bacterium]
MKRFLKWAGIAVLILLGLIGGYAAYIQATGYPTYDVSPIKLAVERTPERVAHGRELALRLCVMCHLDPTTKRLTGVRMLDLPKSFGTAYSRNITQHKSAGIGSWSDGDIAWVLRTGIQPHTGRYLPPWMPKFPHMSDEDLASIIAWLRSDDPYVQASDVASRESEPSFLAKFLSHIAFKPFEYPTSSISHPDTTDNITYGRYLTNSVYDCYQCHSADFATNAPLDPPSSPGFYAGGQKLPNAVGYEIAVSNITSDRTHGIGRYTREQFIELMKTGFRPDGTPMRYPMVRMPSFSDHALGCMYDYLMTVPANANVTATASPSGPWNSKGAKLWDTKGCAGCHGTDGVGFADMRMASSKYPEDSLLYDVIGNPTKYNPLSTMPHYAGHLSQDELHDLALHVRTIKK